MIYGKNNLTTYSYLCSSGKSEKQLNMMTFPFEGSSFFKPTLNVPLTIKEQIWG